MFKNIVGLGFQTRGKNTVKEIDSYIDSLVEGGASEFMCGYCPDYWYTKFGFEVSPNGRFAEHEQITDFETLRQLVERVHHHNLKISINFNAWYYTDITNEQIQKMYEEVNSLGVDSIICGNIGILEILKKNNYKGDITISTILAVYNKEAINFFIKNYKAKKIILSREVTLKEIENLVTDFPEIIFEVFGEGDFCRYNNGLCFAEHKYGVRDICSIVVNDLIIKKRYHPDFKKIILDDNLDNIEKLKKLDSIYFSPYEEIDNIFYELDSSLGDKTELEKNILDILSQNKDNIDLYYDALKPITDKKNKEIISFLKAVKYILDNNLSNENYLLKLKEELETSIKKGFEYYKNEIIKLGGQEKVTSKEKLEFYNRSNNLNLYSYLFFSQFPNIDTVKFPTRGRNYSHKLETINKTLKNKKVGEELIDRGVGLDRIHYDLSYIFGDKLWFRNLLNNI